MAFAEDVIKKVTEGNNKCQGWAVPVRLLEDREREFLRGFAPGFETAVVFGYHITELSEWRWFMGDAGEYCIADIRLKEVCERAVRKLEESGFSAKIVEYPGESGLRFRDVAQAAGAGEIGMSAFLLHPEWGPWIHLRVLAVDAPSETIAEKHTGICTGCGECVLKCPAGAILEDTFDGALCRSCRAAKGEYIPFGPERELKYCTICADVCPVGEKPV